MFFLLLLVGATVALPLQSQPKENLGDDVTEDAKRWGADADVYRPIPTLDPNFNEILRNIYLLSKNQSLSDDVTESGKRMFMDDDQIYQILEPAPILIDLLKTRGVEDNLWDDILQFAAEIAPIVAGPIGKRKLDPEPLVNYLPPSIYSSLIQIGLMPSKKDVEDNLWDDILQWAAEIDPVVNGPIGKRWCMGCLDPILTFDPTLLVTDILVTKLEGRRDVEDNLWDDILQWAAEIAPIVNGPILGKRLLDVDYDPMNLNPIQAVDPALIASIKALLNTRDAEDNLLNDILQLYTEVAPLVNGPIMAGKRAIWWDGIIDPIIEPVLPILQALKRQISDWDAIMKYLEENNTEVHIPDGLIIYKREIEDNLIDDIVSFVSANPWILGGPLGKRQTEDNLLDDIVSYISANPWILGGPVGKRQA